MVKKGISRTIRDARGERRMSLRKLARTIGVSASFLQHVEAGTSKPSARVLLLLAAEFGLDVDTLSAGYGVIQEDMRAFVLSDPKRIRRLMKSKKK